MSTATTTIKTFYEGDIRRFTLADKTYSRLREVLKELYPELPGDFAVKYADEEDEFVTIGSDVELAEAINVANAQGTKALKLYVSGNKNGSIVETKMPASEPATPKSAVPPATPSAAAAVAVAAAPVSTPKAAAAAAASAPAPAAAEPKAETKATPAKPTCAELKQLATAFLQDAKVQAALPVAIQAVLNAAQPDQPLSAKALVDALLKSSSEIANHASVQAVLPFLDEWLPGLQAKLDRVRPEHVQMAKMYAPIALGMLPNLLQSLPILLQQGGLFAGCGQAEGESEGAVPDVNAILQMLPMIMALAGGAGAGAGAAGRAAGCPPFFPPPPPHHPFFGAGPHARGPHHGRHFGGPRGHPLFGRGMREFMREEGRATTAPAESASAPGLGLSDKGDSKGDGKKPASDVHHGITCNGCGATPISGIRYKCTICSDFDMCEVCEAKNVHPAHPLIKIRKQKAAEPIDVHHNVKCDGCGIVPIKGIRYKCSVLPNYDLCETCEAKNAHPHPLIKMRVATPAAGAGAGPSFGHHGPFGGWGGRGRGLHRMFGGFGGRRGDSPCWRRRDGAAAAGAGEQGQALGGNERATAEFVKDLTIPDRSETQPSQTLVKTWSVKNNGSVAWPEGAKLIFVRGDREISAQEEFTVPAAKPGETVEINAVILTPAKKGRYTAFFRLAEKDRAFMFGPRLWIDVFVGEASAAAANGKAEQKIEKKEAAVAVAMPVPSAPAAAAPAPAPAAASPKPAAPAPAPAPTAAAPPSKWAMQLELLASMGFANAELNTYLLERNKGNVQRVAEFLLERMK